MKIIALNGSARKKWNDGQMLEQFIQGIPLMSCADILGNSFEQK